MSDLCLKEQVAKYGKEASSSDNNESKIKSLQADFKGLCKVKENLLNRTLETDVAIKQSRQEMQFETNISNRFEDIKRLKVEYGPGASAYTSQKVVDLLIAKLLNGMGLLVMRRNDTIIKWPSPWFYVKRNPEYLKQVRSGLLEIVMDYPALEDMNEPRHAPCGALQTPLVGNKDLATLSKKISQKKRKEDVGLLKLVKQLTDIYEISDKMEAASCALSSISANLQQQANAYYFIAEEMKKAQEKLIYSNSDENYYACFEMTRWRAGSILKEVKFRITITPLCTKLNHKMQAKKMATVLRDAFGWEILKAPTQRHGA
ncbi:unnamed protein product [Clonostachys rhizophaga]|uniref:Uncharacterized protein n=1 Tax=Clonostachys rhizophaga TaxID=160324 RepID=A0A9N9YTN2_9HYPO|nr:unnamed protein product [Clonostachys rhizophaga]